MVALVVLVVLVALLLALVALALVAPVLVAPVVLALLEKKTAWQKLNKQDRLGKRAMEFRKHRNRYYRNCDESSAAIPLHGLCCSATTPLQ